MTDTWVVKFVNAAAEAEVLDLDADLRAKFLHVTELLSSFGPRNVGLPHIRPLGKQIMGIAPKRKR